MPFPAAGISSLAALATLLYDRGFPIAPVKMMDVKVGQIQPFNTTQIDVDSIRVRARDIKRRHTASGAEMVFGNVCVEGISGELHPWRQQPETLARNYPVQVRLFGADRAITLQNPSVYRPGNFINHAPAMASATVNRATFKFIRHGYEFGANRKLRQMRRYAGGEICATR